MPRPKREPDGLTTWQRQSVGNVWKKNPEALTEEALDRRVRRYRNRLCMLAWLERGEAFLIENPRVGRAMMLGAPEVVERAALGDPELEVRAWTLRGSTLRMLGEAGAEDAFRRSLAVAGRLHEDSPELGSMLAAYGAWKDMVGQHSEALDLVNRALALFENSSDPRVGSCDRLSVSGVLVAKGMVLFRGGASTSETLSCFLESIRKATTQTPYSKQSASGALVVVAVKALMNGEEQVRAEDVLKICDELHRHLARQGETISSRGRCRIRWMEALCLAWVAQGLSRQSEIFLKQAKGSLLSHGSRHAAVELNLDLAYWLQREGRWAELEEVARETAELAKLAGFKSEELVALRQWSLSVKARRGRTMTFINVYRLVRTVTPTDLVQIPSAEPNSRRSRWVSEVGW